jgi:hypothetical protein
VSQHVALDFFQIKIQMIQRVLLQLVRALAEFLIIVEPRDNLSPTVGEARRRRINGALQPRIVEGPLNLASLFNLDE